MWLVSFQRFCFLWLWDNYPNPLPWHGTHAHISLQTAYDGFHPCARADKRPERTSRHAS
jgi:hypothetical protein